MLITIYTRNTAVGECYIIRLREIGLSLQKKLLQNDSMLRNAILKPRAPGSC